MLRQRGYVRPPPPNKTLIALEMLNLLGRRKNLSNKDVIAVNALVHMLSKKR